MDCIVDETFWLNIAILGGKQDSWLYVWACNRFPSETTFGISKLKGTAGCNYNFTDADCTTNIRSTLSLSLQQTHTYRNLYKHEIVTDVVFENALIFCMQGNLGDRASFRDCLAGRTKLHHNYFRFYILKSTLIFLFIYRYSIFWTMVYLPNIVPNDRH